MEYILRGSLINHIYTPLTTGLTHRSFNVASLVLSSESMFYQRKDGVLMTLASTGFAPGYDIIYHPLWPTHYVYILVRVWKMVLLNPYFIQCRGSKRQNMNDIYVILYSWMISLLFMQIWLFPMSFLNLWIYL